MDPGLAEGELVRLREMSGGRKTPLAQQQKHLGGSHFWDAICEVVLTCGLSGLGKQGGRAVYISPGQLQADK